MTTRSLSVRSEVAFLSHVGYSGHEKNSPPGVHGQAGCLARAQTWAENM